MQAVQWIRQTSDFLPPDGFCVPVLRMWSLGIGIAGDAGFWESVRASSMWLQKTFLEKDAPGYGSVGYRSLCACVT